MIRHGFGAAATAAISLSIAMIGTTLIGFAMGLARFACGPPTAYSLTHRPAVGVATIARPVDDELAATLATFDDQTLQRPSARWAGLERRPGAS